MVAIPVRGKIDVFENDTEFLIAGPSQFPDNLELNVIRGWTQDGAVHFRVLRKCEEFVPRPPDNIPYIKVGGITKYSCAHTQT